MNSLNDQLREISYVNNRIGPRDTSVSEVGKGVLES